MLYNFYTLVAVTIFALVHLWAEKARQLDFLAHGKLLSAGGGVAIAYVFVDLLPKLGESDELVRKALLNIFPYFEKHVYIFALAGFLLFFVVGRSHTFFSRQGSFWLSLLSYALFNFLVGYAIADKNNPEVQPLVLFTFALALHYFVNDYTLTREHGQEYARFGRWLLILCLFLGWLTGLVFILPAAAVALVSAFIGGGVIMNVTRHELPQTNPNSSGTFLLAAFAYTAVLLFLG